MISCAFHPYLVSLIKTIDTLLQEPSSWATWVVKDSNLRFKMANPAQIILLGSTFCAMLTLHFSIQLLSEHLLYWKKPKEQKAILVIILMAPLYAIDSYVGLIDFQGSKAFFMFLDSVKECYEAFVRFQWCWEIVWFSNCLWSKSWV